MNARNWLLTGLFVFLALPNIGYSQAESTVMSERVAQTDDYFSRSDHTIRFNPNFVPSGDIAIPISDSVGLFVGFQALNSTDDDATPMAFREITLHPNSFIGGAVLASDPRGDSPVIVDALQVSRVIGDTSKYRELCAFDHRVGGPTVAGTLLATLADGQTVELGAEIGASMVGFEAIPEATIKGGPVISWPNKFCRGVKINNGSCLPKKCGMTLGDMIDLAGQAGLTIPTSIIAAGVDAVAEWLGHEGYTVNGTCGQVRLIFPPIPLGCQCIYVQF